MSSPKKTVGDVNRSNLDGAGAANSLQLAGAITFASEGKINAARDEAFSTFGKKANEEASSRISADLKGNSDRELN
jgi:hypothetical protein